MRIASKINSALLAAFACGTVATFVVLQKTIWPRFAEIERAEALMNHKRVIDAFDTFTDKLQTATQDYAFWDETYRFMQGEGKEEFISSNLMPEFKAVENLGVNALVFLDRHGIVQWGAAYDLETKEAMDGLQQEIAHFSRSHPYLGSSDPKAQHGIIRTSKGLMLIAIAPVLKSDQSGPAVGKVVTAKILSVDAAKELTGVDFTIEEPKHTYEYQALAAGADVSILPDQVKTTSVLNSLIGRPVAILSAKSPRDVSRVGALAIRSATIMMIVAGLLSLGVLWVYLRRAVVSRIEGLRLHFATAGSSGTIKQTAMVSNGDEVGELAVSFNAMAEQVNHLRDALADSAFMSGLSEWAAGTMHNVRNGLVPVTTTTWQIEQMFDGSWIKNIETAVTELSDETTPPERRAKLNAFLIASAARFTDAARKTTELTGRINDASQSVLDIASEFERYAHRDTVQEQIDLVPFLKSVCELSVDRQSSEVEWVLPKVSLPVVTNSIILRQIVSNILINSLEAIEGHAGRGRIEVTVDTPNDKPGFTRLTIADNGEGIAPDRIALIFHRGSSTRKSRKGGLGLHWCANAVRVLGGSMSAHSEGIGHGTSMVIDLPNRQITKEAA